MKSTSRASKALLLLVMWSVLTNLGPERPLSSESWVVSSDGQTGSVTGRVQHSVWKKMSPLWWFLNDDEPDPPEWQLPGKPFFIRQLSWYGRNPLQNFGKYVVGVHDRNYTVVGTAPVYATTWSDFDPSKTGWKFSTIHLGALRLPFIAFENEYVMWYAGWQWWGFFGFKFIFKNSPLQVW
jgi:hypothetical protein